MASFSTFADPLLISTQNTTLWSGNFGTMSWSPSGWTITNPINYTGYGGQSTTLTYDLTSTSCFCSVANVGSQALASCETVPIKLVKDASNSVFFYVNGGTLQSFKQVAAVQTSLSSATYSSSTHKWFRISESGGTMTFATSADGLSWTTFGTPAANPFAVTALTLEPSLGTFSNEASSTTAKWNSFNTAPSGVSTNLFFY